MSAKPLPPGANPEETIPPSGPKAPKRPGPARERVCGVLAESVLTSKGQITIPLAIRSKFQLDAGDSLVWLQDEDGRLLVEPKRTLTLGDIRAAIEAAGIPAPARPFTLKEMDEAVAEALEARHGRR